MTKLNRRNALKAGAALAATSSVSAPQEARAQAPSAPDVAMTVKGETFASLNESNPLEAKVIAFTTVSPDVEASIRFYRDVIGMEVHSDTMLRPGVTTAPGTGDTERRLVLLTMQESAFSQTVRVLEAPPGADPSSPDPVPDVRPLAPRRAGDGRGRRLRRGGSDDRGPFLPAAQDLDRRPVLLPAALGLLPG